MSGELEQLFDAVRRDAMNTNMPEPAELRGVAQRRTRARWVLAGASAAAAVAVVVGVAAAVSRPVAAPPPAAPSMSPSAGVPSATPSVSDSPSPSSAPPGPRSCTMKDLDRNPTWEAGAGSGQFYQTVVVHGAGTTPCQLSGYPVLLYSDLKSGQVKPLPYEHTEVVGAVPATLYPEGVVHFVVHTVNGYAGYDPGSPQCAHPMRYSGLLVELSDATPYALPARTANLSQLQRWHT